MNAQKKIAIVNDISGFGRCSVTVALPILSAMKVQCGILPTAILSNHTEYPEYSFMDFTPYMQNYLDNWKHLQLHFDGLYTGFLGSAEQIQIIQSMMDTFAFEKRIIDPVMGDHGVLYSSYTPDMCLAMKELVTHATLITPNLTELCILTDTAYSEQLTETDVLTMCRTLAAQGISQIAVTGLEQKDQIGNAIYQNGQFDVFYTDKIQPLRPGTGDVFASILAGYSLHNADLTDAVKKAAAFIHDCLIQSSKLQIPINDGVCFEEYLGDLTSLQFL